MNDQPSIRWLIIILTLITAAIHLFLGITGLGSPMGTLAVLFILNGLGYLVLLGALMMTTSPLGLSRSLIGYVLMGYAALTLILYFVMNGFHFGGAAIVAKLDELLLIIALFIYIPSLSTS